MPIVKVFDTAISFKQVQGHGWLPLLSVTFIPPIGSRFVLPLIFDTAASEITLRPDFSRFFSTGQPAKANVGGTTQAASGTETKSTVEVLGCVLKDRKILFLDLGEPNPLFAGLFGRDCFSPFGFGFWENARELYVTLKP
jgi:hypothetical protein